MIMDATYDYQVWNQPILGYRVKYFNPETNRASNDPAEVTIAMDDYKQDKFTKYRSSRAVSVVGVEMVVDYMVETNPTHRNYDKPQLDGVSRVRYYYDLELDASGMLLVASGTKIVTRFLVDSDVPQAVAKSYYDGRGSWDVTQSVPTSWQSQAPRASRHTQPMTSIVTTLFEASSNAEKPAQEWKQLLTHRNQCLDVEYSSGLAGAKVFGWSCSQATTNIGS